MIHVMKGKYSIVIMRHSLLSSRYTQRWSQVVIQIQVNPDSNIVMIVMLLDLIFYQLSILPLNEGTLISKKTYKEILKL